MFAQHLCVNFTQWVIHIPPICSPFASVFVCTKLFGLFTTKGLRVGGCFTILVSESWKQSRSLAHREGSTSLSAWKHNTGAEQSIVVYCLRTCVLDSCELSEPKGPGALNSTWLGTLSVASSHNYLLTQLLMQIHTCTGQSSNNPAQYALTLSSTNYCYSLEKTS